MAGSPKLSLVVTSAPFHGRAGSIHKRPHQWNDIYAEMRHSPALIKITFTALNLALLIVLP